MDERAFSAAVAEFEAALDRGEYFPEAWFDRLSLDDAYRLQLALIDGRGDKRIGWKVGLTSRAIQQQFEVHEPVFGCLLADGKLGSGHVFRRDELIAPGFENELCIVMGGDLAPDATPADVAAAVARVHPAFEIIETRGDLTRQLALALADNAQQKGFVLGPAVERAALPELDKVMVSVRINNVEVATGDGSAVLGHPYNSVAWLAAKLAQFGERVKAGDWIMSGSFTRQFPLAKGDRIAAQFAGIGTVTASAV
ncbi:MAG TPA: fumarylacetoacetate hydrolase family protein [Stellaceae bacterium]|jgi:2-keto-4-pentenoate hydratase|nr:fumarylacetoacetate hydrolase family protein [Stellaceae bacterium]